MSPNQKQLVPRKVSRSSFAGRTAPAWITVLAVALGAAATAGGQTLQLVVNPYEGIEWESAAYHKGNLHTHTTQSDGRLSPEQTIDEYQQRAYRVLAITDHDRSTFPWQKWHRDPDALAMVAIAGNELSRHHHTLSLFSDFATAERDLNTVLDQLASYSAEGLAVLCHPAMHWPRQFGPELGLRTPMALLRQITRGDFTIEAWFRTTDAGRNILMGNYSSQPGALNLELHTGNRVRVFVQPTGEGRTVDLNLSAGALEIDTRDGQWHHLAGVRRQGHVSLFLDGKLLGSQEDTAGSYDLHGEFYHIGRDTRTGPTLFEGDLDQVRLWTRGLTADQVAQLAAGADPNDGQTAEGLLVQYAFETSQGVPVRDGDRAGAVVDDSGGHPRGPFPASAGDTAPATYIADVAEPLSDAGVSSHAMRFRTQHDVRQVPDAAVQYYIDLYTRHDRLIGIEVLNGTRPLPEYALDRQLWDRLLTRLMPARPVWGLATDDMHSPVHLGRDWLVFPAIELEAAGVRRAMIEGAFYFSTIRLHEPQQASVDRTPRIESIVHDTVAGTINVRATVAEQPLLDDAYQWISAGQIVHAGPRLSYRNLDNTSTYARLEIQGSGGTTYTNPFGFRVSR